jgi:hypothetical protein
MYEVSIVRVHLCPRVQATRGLALCRVLALLSSHPRDSLLKGGLTRAADRPVSVE